MSLIIQKFGGTSVADAHHIFNVAKKIISLYKQNNDIVVVVSAQGDTTDKLQNLADEINPNPSGRETDALLSAGEQISAALLSMALQKMGYPAISLAGWQAGILSESNHCNANIISINTERIKTEIQKKNIVIVTGFQGIDQHNDITTLGRGGSDTSAVALAAALNADACKIYTDVDGVYTADPRIVLSAKKWSLLDYDTMFELASYGAQVLHNRSIEIAKKNNVKIEVLSSLMDDTPGTVITNDVPKTQNILSGISLKNKLAKVSVTFSGDCQEVFDRITDITKNIGIHVDKSLKSVGKRSKNALSLVIDEINIGDFLGATQKLMHENKDIQVFYEKNKSEISVINISESLNINIASIIFETLSEMNIEVEMVACDQKRVSIVVSSEYTNSAVNAIHSKLFEEDNII